MRDVDVLVSLAFFFLLARPFPTGFRKLDTQYYTGKAGMGLALTRVGPGCRDRVGVGNSCLALGFLSGLHGARNVALSFLFKPRD